MWTLHYPTTKTQGILLLLLFSCSSALANPIDPLDSPLWLKMHQHLLDGGKYVFDQRVKIIAPKNAENTLNVPVKVDASALGEVKRIVVFADLNPIPKILDYEPLQAQPSISFNFKVQQATALRAAALDSEDVWRVGGMWLDAAGGGCTQPSVGSANADWNAQLGHVTARLWPNKTGQRVRLRIMHPMDTGLADKIPEFYIERLEITQKNTLLARLYLYEPISENPTLTLDVSAQGAVDLFAVDNNGNQMQASILPQQDQLALGFKQ
jgi:sulfur-oxidizing protein SoxY